MKRVKKREELEKEFLEQVRAFRKELKKHMLTFITGGFSFVAALVWRDAIKGIVDYLISTTWFIENVPIKEGWFVQLLTALFVTIIAVFGIFVATRLLKPEE